MAADISRLRQVDVGIDKLLGVVGLDDGVAVWVDDYRFAGEVHVALRADTVAHGDEHAAVECLHLELPFEHFRGLGLGVDGGNEDKLRPHECLGALEKTAKGYAVADGMTYQTKQPDIFVGGDIYTGPKFAIDAIAAGKQGAISLHRYVQEGQSLTIGRDRLEYRSLDKDNLDFDGIKADYDSTPRQVPHTIDVASFKDNRQTFTEEQLKKETARCLGCGASVVDPNKCLGCGICTTRCKFDAIHLRKRTNVESIEYPIRKKVLPEFIAERQQKIQIRKLRQEK